jgi:putative endonuclease
MVLFTRPSVLEWEYLLVIRHSGEPRIVSGAGAGIQRNAVNKQPAVYILANKRNGTLYVGVTSDLVERIWEHKNNMLEGFTKHYHVHNLVWYVLHESMESAIMREKRLKDWKRAWKLELIESKNPDWLDLYDTLV